MMQYFCTVLCELYAVICLSLAKIEIYYVIHTSLHDNVSSGFISRPRAQRRIFAMRICPIIRPFITVSDTCTVTKKKEPIAGD